MRLTGLFILILVALTFGLAACGGGNDTNEQAEQVIQRFLEVGQEAGVKTQVLLDEIPSDLPQGLPQYPGSSLVGSVVSSSENQRSLAVLWESSASLDEILLFYEEALENDPWQVVLSSSTETLAVLQFKKVDDANFMGGVAIQKSEDGKEGSTILVSAQVFSEGGTEQKPFELGASKPLPRNFPKQIPIYPQATITDTGWARSPGNLDFQVNYLTSDTPRDVIDFYHSELGGKGWKLTDEPSQELALVLSFENTTSDETWSGSITADLFEKAPDYALVTLQLRIGPASAATPEASPAAPQ